MVDLSPKQRLAKSYGEGFPEVVSTDGADWRKWVDGQRKRQEGPLRDKRLHWSRHRHFRHGYQWISTRDGRTWREPQADVNDVKAVLNLIGPALDFRLGILSEQKPGFRHEAIGGNGTASRESAEAQQAVAEYYFYLLRAWNVFLDAWYNAQTDGVSFIHIYIDPTAGPTREDLDLIPPTDERFPGLQSQGYNVNAQGLLELPYQDEGLEAPPGTEPRILYEGEIAARVLLAHEVVFDPEARSVNGPVDKARWCIVRRMRDIAQARLETGNPKLESEQAVTSQNDVLDMPMDRQMGWQRGLPPFPTSNLRTTDGVPEYLIWIAPNLHEPGLEKGIWLRVIGNEIVERGEELPGGIIPLARVTDGSSDPSMFPRPVMADWIGDQLAINALLSSLLKHARWFAGGRLLSMKGTVLEETYSNIVGSNVEYAGTKPDVFPNVPAGGDAWRLLDWLIKKLEDKHGWNDIARGQLTGTSGASAADISGRAVLATRELFERAFGPVVRAAAEGATEFAHLIVKYSAWLFDTPRMIPAVGGRGDLAKRIDSEMLGDRPVVYVDPETMMPLPRALRQQLLEEQLDKGRISQATYQKRSVFADIRDLQMGDTAQWERAQWINTEIEERWEELAAMAPEQRFSPEGGIPVLWQDVNQIGTATAVPSEGAVGPASQVPALFTSVHKPALQEIILDNRKPWQMRAVALERWGIYDQLERCVNDPTGQTQVPVMVLGVPEDKKMMMQMAAQAATTPEQQGGAPVPGTPPQPTQAAPATAAAPESSSVAPAAGNLQPPKLGEFGSVERQA